MDSRGSVVFRREGAGEQAEMSRIAYRKQTTIAERQKTRKGNRRRPLTYDTSLASCGFPLGEPGSSGVRFSSSIDRGLARTRCGTKSGGEVNLHLVFPPRNVDAPGPGAGAA